MPEHLLILDTFVGRTWVDKTSKLLILQTDVPVPSEEQTHNCTLSTSCQTLIRGDFLKVFGLANRFSVT